MKRSTFGLIVIVFVILISMLFSCTERARVNMAKNMVETVPIEKVIIIERSPKNFESFIYKVKRVKEGVVTHIVVNDLYQVGDTIFHQFEKNAIH